MDGVGDAFCLSIATVVVGGDKGGYSQFVEVASKLPWRTETGVSGEIIVAEGGFQVGNDKIRIYPIGSDVLKAFFVFVVFPCCISGALNLRLMLHDISTKQKRDGLNGVMLLSRIINGIERFFLLAGNK